MKYQTDHEETIRTDMISEALALLRIIESDRIDDDADENCASQELRLRAQALARRLVAEMVAALQDPGREATLPPVRAAA